MVGLWSVYSYSVASLIFIVRPQRLLGLLHFLSFFEFLLQEPVKHPTHVFLGLRVFQTPTRFLRLFKVLHRVLRRVGLLRLLFQLVVRPMVLLLRFGSSSTKALVLPTVSLLLPYAQDLLEIRDDIQFVHA